MITIIRVKRKINEDPADRLIIECEKNIKKKKTDTESVKQILEYAGTAKTENDIPDRISELNKIIKKKEDLQNEYKSAGSKSNIKENNLNESKKETKLHRYVLVNKKRGLNDENGDINVIDVISSDYLNETNEDVMKPVKVSDKDEKNIKDEITCNGVPLVKEKINKTDYIYDLYYSNNSETYLDLLYANNYNIQSYCLEEDEFVNIKHTDEYYRNEDDEDSNDENNYRNDYPDEDDHGNDYYDDYDHDYDEYDTRLSSLMKKSCAIDDYDDSNYYNDDNADEDAYNSELNPYTSYESYKKKILKEFNEDDF